MYNYSIFTEDSNWEIFVEEINSSFDLSFLFPHIEIIEGKFVVKIEKLESN